MTGKVDRIQPAAGRRGRITSPMSLRFCILSPLVCILFTGCAQHATTQPTTRPANIRDRQDRAMRDPFNYSPDADKTDISGGGLTDFDKNAFNRDLKHVLDP
jgi:hypothetical protein